MPLLFLTNYPHWSWKSLPSKTELGSCSEAVAGKETELEPILSELRAALREHDRFVRLMAAQALNRDPSAKAAD